MKHKTDPSSHDPTDVSKIIRLLRGETPGPPSEAAELFDAGRAITLARAPGRLDVMGGIADYSGSLVLEMPIAEAAVAAVQPRDDRQVKVVSLGADEAHRSTAFACAVDEVVGVSYEAARERFAADPKQQWAAYIAGTLTVLAGERGASFDNGMSILVSSDVPEGKGVSSSAAIEVATMNAVAGAMDIALDGRQLALLCQMVENRIVGAPCGVMDQMTSACGRSGELMRMLCQPAELRGHVAIPQGVAVWGIDSGIRHAVSGADYGSVRVGAFMGRRMLGHDGHLANLDPEEFDPAQLPESVQGQAFIDQYSSHGDDVTTIDLGRTYAVRVPTGHPVYENARVHRFAELLGGEIDEATLIELGELMYASHDSYSACGLGSDGTDRLVELVREAGPASGVYGAKITGGGSGGTVAVLGRADTEATIEKIAVAYADETGRQPYIFRGSSPGAVAFGTMCIDM